MDSEFSRVSIATVAAAIIGSVLDPRDSSAEPLHPPPQRAGEVPPNVLERLTKLPFHHGFRVAGIGVAQYLIDCGRSMSRFGRCVWRQFGIRTVSGRPTTVRTRAAPRQHPKERIRGGVCGLRTFRHWRFSYGYIRIMSAESSAHLPTSRCSVQGHRHPAVQSLPSQRNSPRLP